MTAKPAMFSSPLSPSEPRTRPRRARGARGGQSISATRLHGAGCPPRVGVKFAKDVRRGVKELDAALH